MSAIRLLDTGLAPARRNVALTAALVELHAEGRIPDTLRFHRYPRSVLLGRHQETARSCDPAFCARVGIEIARRVTGGGAVHMSPSVLAWEIVARRARFGMTAGEIGGFVCAAIARGLARLGVETRHRPPNDIVIGGRKLGGASGIGMGGALLYQGTVILAADRAEMAAALSPPGADVAAAQHALAGQLTSLSEHLAETPGMAEVMAAILAGLAEATGWRFEPGQPGEAELARAARLAEAEIGTDAFAFAGEAA